MKYYACGQCHQQIFFENQQCDHCKVAVGFVASEKSMSSFQIDSDGIWHSLQADFKHKRFKPCYNYAHYQTCNWLIPANSQEVYCESCLLTHTIPPLDDPQNIVYWQRLEKAKRRFLYLAQRLNMFPRPKKNTEDRYGLWFEFLLQLNGQPVMTGHSYGLITLNASEADVVFRETTRESMGENYRTLLGHFRHESGHYYFDVMQHLHPELLDEFRYYFGDERDDYSAALKRHYEQGPPTNWQTHFISSYATAHPWEDWAETWAHYLHMMDTLETAYYGTLRVDGNGSTLKAMQFRECPIGGHDFEHILENWITLTFNLNALNRSMGLDDAYPFQLTDVVKDKLRFIHRHILHKAFAQHTEARIT